MGLFDPIFGDSAPSTVTPLDVAIGKIASEFGVSPNAIKQVIQVESGGNPRASTGSYNGLTQIGSDTFKENGGTLGGMTYDEYKAAPPEKQIDAYGDYLRHYKFSEQMQKHGVDLSKLSPDQQFAVLQGMQFSPNGQSWKAALAQGDFSVPVTNTRQASALGDTSLAAMAGSSFGRAAGGPPLPPAQTVVSLPPITAPVGSPPALQKPLPPQPLNLARPMGNLPSFQWSPPQQQAAQQARPQPMVLPPQIAQAIRQPIALARLQTYLSQLPSPIRPYSFKG